MAHSKCLLGCESSELIARKISRHFEYFQQNLVVEKENYA